MQPRELLKRLAAERPPVVIDVRSGFEYRAEHIPGALHAPLWKVLLRLAKLPADRQCELVLTCEHGPRAELVRGVLAGRGYGNVTLLDGQMAAWRRNGHPLQRG